MFLSKFFKKLGHTRPNDLRLVIDIGSLSIKIVLFKHKGASVEVVKKIATRFPQRADAKSLMSFINQYLHETIFGIIKDARAMPAEVLVGFSSDFILSVIDKLEVVRPSKNKKISEDELVLLYRRGVEALMKKDPSYVLIDSFPLSVAIDGYEISDTTGDIRGSKIEIKTFGLFMQKEYWEHFRHLPKILGGLNVKYISNQLANALALPKILGVDSGFFIDIGGTATEVMLIDHRRIAFIDRINFGGDPATKALTGTEASYMEAENLKHQYAIGIVPEVSRERIRTTLKKVADSWRAELMQSLSGNFGFIMPDKIYVFGGGAMLPEMKTVLNDETLFKDLVFSEHVEIHFLDADAVTPKGFEGEKLSGSTEVTILSLILHMLGGAYAR